MSEQWVQQTISESVSGEGRYLVDQQGALIRELTPHEGNWYHAVAGQSLRLVQDLTTAQLVDDLMASKVGDDLVVALADGTSLVALGYFTCDTAEDTRDADADAACALTLAADAGAGYTIPSGAGHDSDQAQIIYHHGDQSTFAWSFDQLTQNADALALAQALEEQAEPAIGAAIVPLWAPLAGGAAALGVVSGSGSSTEGVTSPATPVPATLVEGDVSAGPVIAGHGLLVKVFDNQGKVLDTAPVEDDGTFKLDLLNTYRGLALLQVIDLKDEDNNDYINEVDGQAKDLEGDLRSVVFIDGNGTYKVPVNPLTEMAVLSLLLKAGDKGTSETVLGDITAVQVDEAMAKIANAFGLSGLSQTPLLTIDAKGQPNTDSDAYGASLALLSAMAQEQGQTMPQLLKQLGDEIEQSSDHQLSLDARYKMLALARNMGMDTPIQAETLKLPNAEHIEGAWHSLQNVVSAELNANVTATQMGLIGIQNASDPATISLVNDLLKRYSGDTSSMDSVAEVQQLVDDTNSLLLAVDNGTAPSLALLHKLGLSQVTDATLGVVQQALAALPADKLAIDTWGELNNLATQEVNEYNAALAAMQGYTGGGDLTDAQFSDLGIDVSTIVPNGIVQDDHLSFIESALARLNANAGAAPLTHEAIAAAVDSYANIIGLLDTSSILDITNFENIGLSNVTTINQSRDVSLTLKNANYADIDTLAELEQVINTAITL